MRLFIIMFFNVCAALIAASSDSSYNYELKSSFAEEIPKFGESSEPIDQWNQESAESDDDDQKQAYNDFLKVKSKLDEILKNGKFIRYRKYLSKRAFDFEKKKKQNKQEDAVYRRPCLFNTKSCYFYGK